MSLMHSPQIVTSGLVFAYDMANTQKSWKGAPTTNLLSNPNNFNAWVQIGITVTASSEPAPVGSESAFAWTCVNSTNHQLYQARTSASTSQFSVYAKMTAHRGFYLAVYNNGYAAYFDLASGTVTSTVGAGVVGTINYYQNGWWICNISVPSSAVEVHIGFLDAVYTGTSNSPWAVSTAVGTTGLIACSQFEVGTFRTPYVNGTRSNTQAIVDLVGSNTVTANSLTYNSDGTISFLNNSGFSIPSINFADAQTIEIWLKPLEADGSRRNPYNQAYAGYGTWTHEPSGVISYYYGDGGGDNSPYVGHGSNFTVGQNEIACVCTTRDLTTSWWYKNGVQYNSYSHSYGSLTATSANITIGNGYAGAYYGDIYAVKLYNRALSAAEVRQNFNALRGRFGI